MTLSLGKSLNTVVCGFDVAYFNIYKMIPCALIDSKIPDYWFYSFTELSLLNSYFWKGVLSFASM